MYVCVIVNIEIYCVWFMYMYMCVYICTSSLSLFEWPIMMSSMCVSVTKLIVCFSFSLNVYLLVLCCVYVCTNYKILVRKH